MALLSFRTSTYARNIYIFGSTSFDSIPAEYHEAVKQHGAATYSDEQIKESYDSLYINEQEFNDTMAYKYPVEVPEEATEPTE